MTYVDDVGRHAPYNIAPEGVGSYVTPLQFLLSQQLSFRRECMIKRKALLKQSQTAVGIVLEVDSLPQAEDAVKLANPCLPLVNLRVTASNTLDAQRRSVKQFYNGAKYTVPFFNPF